jgi:DNA end-binding protein Ku
MARPIWTGSLSFGLVNVPVGLYSAIEQKDIRFHQFQQGTKRRVRNQRVAESTKKEVPYEKVVKGYEVSKDKWVMVEPEDLEAVEPGPSRTIEIEDFVALEEIDPVYYEKPYYLAPTAKSGAEHSYQLLRAAMERADRVGIARFVMRGKQYLAAVRPRGDVLVLETLYFHDEVRDPAQAIADLPGKGRANQRELDIALQLIESLTTTWKPERYEDTYRERVLDMIKRKGKGQEIAAPEREREGAEVVDLMEALRESLERGGRKSPSRRASTSRAKKSTRATKSPSRSSGSRRKKAS